MKFLKKLLITLLIIVLLVGGVIAAAYVLLYDNQTKGFKNIEGGFDITNHVADSVYNSLENIKVTNYEENHLDLELTEDNINAFIIKMVQTKVPEYPETKSSIVEMNGAALDCIYVRGVGETFELYACVRYKSIMYSSLKISANFKIEDNTLSFKVDAVKLGKYINISPEKASSMLGGFLPTTGEGESPVKGLDLKTMTFSLDLNQIIQDNIQEPFVRDLLRALKYDAGIQDGVIRLRIDTKDIFTGPRTPVLGDASEIADLSTIIAGLDPLNPGNITLDLNESQFNALAENDLKDGLAQFRPSFEFGTKQFEFGIDFPYYRVNTAMVETSFDLNGVQSTACFYAGLEPVYDDGHTEIVTFDITAKIASVGNLEFTGLDDFTFNFQIEADSLTNGKAKIKDFTIDKENSKVTLTLEPKISFSL